MDTTHTNDQERKPEQAADASIQADGYRDVQMEWHEAANIFPLDEEHIDELAEDIRQNGQKVPIEIYDGKILDGRRRAMACDRAGVKPITRSVSPADPVAYALSLNLHRRHLSISQLGMIGQRAREVHDKAAKERQRAGGGDKRSKNAGSVQNNCSEPIRGQARDQAGEAVGVSGGTIERAQTVLNQGIPEVVKAVDDGNLSVYRAAEIAKRPQEEQTQALQEALQPRAKSRRPADKSPPEPEPGEAKILGKGVFLAHEAINVLMKIPRNDALRKRGFEIVATWIKRNK